MESFQFSSWSEEGGFGRRFCVYIVVDGGNCLLRFQGKKKTEGGIVRRNE